MAAGCSNAGTARETLILWKGSKYWAVICQEFFIGDAALEISSTTKCSQDPDHSEGLNSVISYIS